MQITALLVHSSTWRRSGLVSVAWRLPSTAVLCACHFTSHVAMSVFCSAVVAPLLILWVGWLWDRLLVHLMILAEEWFSVEFDWQPLFSLMNAEAVHWWVEARFKPSSWKSWSSAAGCGCCDLCQALQDVDVCQLHRPCQCPLCSCSFGSSGS